MMTRAARTRHRRWPRAKSERTLQRAAKDSERKIAHNGFANGDEPDRLLLSALNYWEVERDLIEERLAAVRFSRATS
jgi:hypothetical protein